MCAQESDTPRSPNQEPGGLQWSSPEAIEAVMRAERKELQRTAHALSIELSSLWSAFLSACLEQLAEEDWARLRNTDSFKRRTKEEVARFLAGKRDYGVIFDALERGIVLPPPLVL